MLSLVLMILPAIAPPSPAVAFTLPDEAGKVHQLTGPAVVVFLACDCPLARRYAPRLRLVADRYKRNGIQFLAVAARDETADEVARFRSTFALPFPVLRDVGGVAAVRFGAVRSPEAFVVDRDGRMRYRGRIDDEMGVMTGRPGALSHDLVNALDAVLTGRPVAVTVTDAPGCPLRLREPGEPTGVTYSREVAPILQRRCQVCHRPGQSGPFSMLTYADTAPWGAAMLEVIDAGRMPPWGAAPGHRRFANDPSLSEEEKRTLRAWVEGGCAEGDPKHLPPPRSWPEGWTIGEPDVVLQMPEPFRVPAEGVVEYQYIAVDPGFREDRWVTAAEIRPGNPRVVHHCNIFLQPPGVDDPEVLVELGTLGSYCLTMMAQGTPPLVLKDGRAKRIPAGWKVVFVLHYQTVGTPQTDRTRLGLRFMPAADVKAEVATKLLFDPELRIPPRAARHEVFKEWTAPSDVLLLSFFPHMHLRGRSFRYELVHPDGRTETLLDVPRFDFGWQHRYELAEPLRVKAGSRLRCSAVYDNSADNPNNPNPEAEVRAGQQSWDEMFNGYFDVCLAEPRRSSWALWVVMGLAVGGCAAVLARRRPAA